MSKNVRVRQGVAEKLKESLVLPTVKQGRYNLCRPVLQVNNKPQLFPCFIRGGINRSEESGRQQLWYSHYMLSFTKSAHNGKAAFVLTHVSSVKYRKDFTGILVNFCSKLSFPACFVTTIITSYEIKTEIYNRFQKYLHHKKVVSDTHVVMFHICLKDMQSSECFKKHSGK